MPGDMPPLFPGRHVLAIAMKDKVLVEVDGVLEYVITPVPGTEATLTPAFNLHRYSSERGMVYVDRGDSESGLVSNVQFGIYELGPM